MAINTLFDGTEANDNPLCPNVLMKHLPTADWKGILDALICYHESIRFTDARYLPRVNRKML